jgi:hypothetical protein
LAFIEAEKKRKQSEGVGSGKLTIGLRPIVPQLRRGLNLMLNILIKNPSLEQLQIVEGSDVYNEIKRDIIQLCKLAKARFGV